MERNEFKKLIKKNSYQVFLFYSPASLPFSFVKHTWFVINKKGKLHRWDVLWREEKSKFRWTHLYKNHFPPTQGIEILPLYGKYYWKSKIVAAINGNKAKKLIKTIENSPRLYPYKSKYHFMGPNCNTFTAWALSKHQDIKITLPWSAWGKKNNNP